MTRPSETGVSPKSTGEQLTAAEFTTVNDTLNAVVTDYASISEGVDADTLDGSAKSEFATAGDIAEVWGFIGEANGLAPLDENSKVPAVNLPISYGETKLWNITKNDIPLGWHVCDGTNGTEDLSLSNPSSDTVYIMYIGGDYTAMTARTININNDASATTSYTLTDPIFGTTLTSIEDGAPFELSITDTQASGNQALTIACTRDSDDYVIMIFGQALDESATISLILTQYIDCTWNIHIV